MKSTQNKNKETDKEINKMKQIYFYKIYSLDLERDQLPLGCFVILGGSGRVGLCLSFSLKYVNRD